MVKDNKIIIDLRIQLKNATDEKIKLEKKIKELNEGHSNIMDILIKTFDSALKKQSEEIKSLKENKAKIEADLILKELRKIISSQKSKRGAE